MDGWMDGWVIGGWEDGWMDRGMDGWEGGWTQSYSCLPVSTLNQSQPLSYSHRHLRFYWQVYQISDHVTAMVAVHHHRRRSYHVTVCPCVCPVAQAKVVCM